MDVCETLNLKKHPEIVLQERGQCRFSKIKIHQFVHTQRFLQC